jgi:hypothetical protein
VVDNSQSLTLHPAFIEALQADRQSLNARFALRQQSGARIDEAAFQKHLQTTVNSLVALVGRVLPERARLAVNGLFDASLDLFAAGLLGPTTKHAHVAAAWREVLPQAVRIMAREPLRVAGCLSNAVENIASQPGSRPEEWITAMRGLSSQCDSVENWLELGKLAAWRAGLVQYRQVALQIARELPPALARSCLEVGADTPDEEFSDILDRLHADPWYRPENGHARSKAAALQIVRRTGGFRGFGGPCLRPPTVVAHDEGLFVTDGQAAWQLFADAFGTLWYRVPNLPAKSKTLADVTLDAAGRVDWAGGAPQKLPGLAQASSTACDGHTLAVTLPTSHYVYLVARVSE